MFTKFDKRFEQTAAEPARRRAAIADLSKLRTIFFWLAIAMSVIAIASTWNGQASGLILVAAIIWSIFFKFESDLRLLRVIERLQKDRDEKPTA
jgi:threonine/homoserine/homoserine lactone efflux protein